MPSLLLPKGGRERITKTSVSEGKRTHWPPRTRILLCQRLIHLPSWCCYKGMPTKIVNELIFDKGEFEFSEANEFAHSHR